MNKCGLRKKDGTLKRAAAIVGVGAIIALGALAIAYDSDDSATANLAGSGDAPSNTTYAQPNVSNMNMGATTTWAAPGSVEATTLASPAVKAGK